MDIKFNQPIINISSRLFVMLKQAIARQAIKGEFSQITFNYRDTSYSSEAGGYHPVEIALHKDSDNDRWTLLYVTDFSFYGSELCKDLDFDISRNTFSGVYAPPRPLTHRSVKEMFSLWETNFLSYLEYGAFDEIEVTTC